MLCDVKIVLCEKYAPEDNDKYAVRVGMILLARHKSVKSMRQMIMKSMRSRWI